MSDGDKCIWIPLILVILEAEARGLQVGSQPGQLRETLSQNKSGEAEDVVQW